MDAIEMTGDGRSVSYTTHGGESPNVGLGIENAGADYEFTIGQVTLGHGGTVTLPLDKAKSRLVVGFKADQPGTFAYMMTRIDDAGAHAFDDEGVEWSPTETLSVDYGSWDGSPKGSIEVTVDKGDGKPQSARLENEKKPEGSGHGKDRRLARHPLDRPNDARPRRWRPDRPRAGARRFAAADWPRP